jgi:hypothetical protein
MMINTIYIKALMRRARAEGDDDAAIAWLDSIITSQFVVAQKGRVLTGSTIDGQSFQWTVPSGLSPIELIQAAELAIGYIETQNTPSTHAQAYF